MTPGNKTLRTKICKVVYPERVQHLMNIMKLNRYYEIYKCNTETDIDGYFRDLS